MKRAIFICILLALLLSACVSSQPVPIATATGTSFPTNTPIPTSTKIPTPPVPMIDVDGVKIPDPQVSNPELFDLKNPNSPIVLFANAFNVNHEDVLAGLHTELESPVGMDSFATLRTADNVALFMAQQDSQTKKWNWQEAMPGNYWGAQNKWAGFYIKSYHLKYLDTYLQLDKFADGGILSLSGQINPGPDIENGPIYARDYLIMAKDNNMSFDFNYVVEPGKFPKNTTADNIDEWLNTRLTEIANEIMENNPDKPVLIQFNEAWDKANWNTDANPLKDKYGEKWLEEYIYQILTISISKGLVANTDFIIMFNENGMYNNLAKQKLVHDKLAEARANAVERLMFDPVMATTLKQMGINKPEDINIMLGTEMHIKLGENGDGHVFMPDPTIEQINFLANIFEDLGGIIMTEVNPNGSDNQKIIFLAKIIQVLASNENLHGFIIWNPVPDDENGQDIYKISPTFLFDSNGTPTRLYYELLRETPAN